MDAAWSSRLRDTLYKLNTQQITRTHTTHHPDPSDLLRVPNRPSSMDRKVFASNDYLGLAEHPEVRWIGSEIARQYGMGPRSSPLMSGYTHLHARLEQRLAGLTQKESCVVFPTGFAANVSLLSALSEKGEVAIFSDALNHASIIDGARLASRNGAELLVYRHGDLHHLEELLLGCTLRHKIVVTESLFSMDGDFIDLQGLVRLKQRVPFLLIVDEAHAMLVAGDRGGGLNDQLCLQDKVDVIVGTLSKAFGCMGGFVCCSETLRTVLVSRGRGHIFSTSLPMPIVAAAVRAMDIAQRETWRQKHLHQLIDRFNARLGTAAKSWIIPVVVGAPEATLHISSLLKQDGFYVPAIRPPTVQPGTCRLRISLSAAHSFRDLDRLMDSLQRHLAYS